MADIELMIQEVKEFLGRLESQHAMRNLHGSDNAQLMPQYVELDRLILGQAQMIEKIARYFDEDLADEIRTDRKGMYVWRHGSRRDGAIKLLAVLEGQEREAAIFGTTGPQLAAEDMHPWVWEEAAPRWDAGFYRDAVQAAATRVFDTELPKKLQVQPTSNPADLFAAFAPDKKSGPVLRFVDTDSGDASWASLHRGTMLFGQGCVMSIRNPRTHRLTVKEDQVALEELAALSLLARWIDDAERQDDH